MANPQSILRFIDFSAGHGGIADPVRVKQSGWFGDNMVAYRTGLLGVRSGLKDMGITGIGAAPAAGSPYGFSIIGSYLYVVTDKLYRVLISDLPVAAAEAFASYPGALVPNQWVPMAASDTGDIYTLANNGLYRHAAALTTAAVSTPTPMTNLVRWRFWLVAASVTYPNRIYYSDFNADTLTSDFNTWSEFIPIGDSSPITAIVPLFNTLYVAKRTGWWAVTGELGFTSYVREVLAGYGPADGRLVSRGADNRAAMWLKDTPAWFNGASVRTDDMQQGVEFIPAGARMVCSTATRHRTLFAFDDGAHTKVLGIDQNAYESHTLASRVTAIAPEDPQLGGYAPKDVVFLAKRALTPGEAVKVYSWAHDLDRPGQTTDTFAAPGDDSVIPLRGSFTTPVWLDPQGRLTMLRTVQVQYRTWGGNTDVNILRMRPIVHGIYGGGQQIGDWQDHPLQAAEIDPNGEDGSVRFNLGDQGRGNGIQLEFQLAGFAIREIHMGVQFGTQAQ